MRLRTPLLVVLLCVPLLTLATVPAAGPERQYQGAGNIVTSFSSPAGTLTVVDNGAVRCRDMDQNGVYELGQGGGCITFAQMGANDAIHVRDSETADGDLAFQVCVDNNGDGICSGNGESGAYDPAVCADRILFSHSTQGFTANPLHVNTAYAETFWTACGNGGFPGFVIILCAGLHGDKFGGSPHTHEATHGVIVPVSAPNTGSGDYCGGITAAKAYTTDV